LAVENRIKGDESKKACTCAAEQANSDAAMWDFIVAVTPSVYVGIDERRLDKVSRGWRLIAGAPGGLDG
jgi:hypothetical protein